MNIEMIPWIVRAILILVGIILAIVIIKGKKTGRYQRYALRFFVIGTTSLILGVVLLFVSFILNIPIDYAWFLATVGVIIIVIGLVIRNTLEKNR